MDTATIEKLATTAVIAGAAFAASKVFEAGWKVATGRPIPAEDSDDVTIASLVLFAATSAAIAAVQGLAEVARPQARGPLRCAPAGGLSTADRRPSPALTRAAGGAPGPYAPPTRSRGWRPRPRPT